MLLRDADVEEPIWEAPLERAKSGGLAHRRGDRHDVVAPFADPHDLVRECCRPLPARGRPRLSGERVEAARLMHLVDFVVLRDRRPLFAVECKSGQGAIGPAVRYFAERAPIPRFYQVHRGEKHFASGKVTVVPFARFCADLGMP